MVAPLFLIPGITLLMIVVYIVLEKVYSFNNKKSLTFNLEWFNVIKITTLASLMTSLFYEVYLWKAYPRIHPQSDMYTLIYPGNAWLEFEHALGLPFIILSSLTLIIAALTAWYTVTNVVLFNSLLLLIEICLVGSFGCTSLFQFLLFFEASALPILILIIYCGNPRRERLKASYYFIFFTLYGSISLLLFLLNTYTLQQLNFFSGDLQPQTSYTSWILLFTAFAVKIPLFPFHIWLPHAHVESSTSTSIILAALALKLGGYGLIKFMIPFFTPATHLYFRPIALTVCMLGVVYGGLISIRQLDLKRQVAFSSIAHMSFAIMGVFTLTEVGIKGSVYLMLSHGFVSAALFFLIGVLSDRYHTRSIMAYSGLLSTMPMFSAFLILASLANVGFPGTSGFIPEILILVGIVSTFPTTLLIVLIGMLLTAAGSLVMLLRLLFGHVRALYNQAGWVDITLIEFTILTTTSLLILIMGVSDPLNMIVYGELTSLRGV